MSAGVLNDPSPSRLFLYRKKRGAYGQKRSTGLTGLFDHDQEHDSRDTAEPQGPMPGCRIICGFALSEIADL
jgi:hypothetical protein